MSDALLAWLVLIIVIVVPVCRGMKVGSAKATAFNEKLAVDRAIALLELQFVEASE